MGVGIIKRDFGGIPCGFRKNKFDFIEIHKGHFCLVATIRDKTNGVQWQWMVVYGPTNNGVRKDFLDEMAHYLNSFDGFTCICGDFNMIRSEEEKNNGRVDWSRLNLFNDFIQLNGLVEIENSGKKFTWSNNQSNTVLEILDRFIMSRD